MRVLDIGCGDLKENWIPDSDGIDLFDYGQMYQFNIEETFPWPVEDNLYDEVVAQHILEHIKNGYSFIEIMNEVWRVSKPGALFRGAAPHFPSSPNFYRDPTHCRMLNENSFDIFFKDSPIHAGSGYNIKCAYKCISIGINHNRDLIWNFRVIK